MRARLRKWESVCVLWMIVGERVCKREREGESERMSFSISFHIKAFQKQYHDFPRTQRHSRKLWGHESWRPFSYSRCHKWSKLPSEENILWPFQWKSLLQCLNQLNFFPRAVVVAQWLCACLKIKRLWVWILQGAGLLLSSLSPSLSLRSVSLNRSHKKLQQQWNLN